MALRYRNELIVPPGRLLPLVCAVCLAFAGSANASEPDEYEVKAAFIYNFAKFVEWPPARLPDVATAIQICVLGANPLREVLERSVSGKQVKGRSVEVRGIASYREAGTCHICFISTSEEARVEQILRAMREEPVLTVSDLDAFAEKGGTIGLKTTNKKVRFEVNMVAARQSGLKLSSQLLKVAAQIIGQVEDVP